MSTPRPALPLDPQETRDPAVREAAQLAALAEQVAHARHHAPAFAQALAGVEPTTITSRAALARLPVTRKSQLLAAQQAARARQAQGGRAAGDDPFGGFSAIGWAALARAGAPAPGPARRVFQSPGTIYEPEGTAPDYWRMARAIRAAGFRAGDLIHNSFGYHLTPAGSMMETGAHALGCTVFPGGVGQTELQLQAMQELQPVGYIGTPSFLRILLDKAAEAAAASGTVAAGKPLPFLRHALVSGEACPPALRQWFAERGVDAYQCYATADLGLVAYETAAREGLVLDEGVIVEIVRPGTDEPVPASLPGQAPEVGEVVVTTLNPDYPLIRFGTGDLSAVLPGTCPTGRTGTRIRGWLGRADQTTKVRGMFVHPGQVAEALRRTEGLAGARARLVVSGELAQDAMCLQVEVAGTPEGLAARLADAMRDITRLRCEVALVAPGSLPNDGKVIEDARTYS